MAGMQIRQSSAFFCGEVIGLRKLPVVSKYIDIFICIGCKVCEVAC